MEIRYLSNTFTVLTEEELQQAWAEIDKIADGLDEILTSVELDDHVVTSELLPSLRDALTNALCATVRSLSHTEIVAGTKESLCDYVPRLAKATSTTANPFYAEPDRAAWEQLGTYIDGLGWVVTATDRLSQVPSEFSFAASFTEFAEQLKSRLKQLLDALNVHDFVLAADTLLYEMEPLLRGLQDDLERHAKE